MTIQKRVQLGLWLSFVLSLRDGEGARALKEPPVVEHFTNHRDRKDPWICFGEWISPFLVLLTIAAGMGIVIGLFRLLLRFFK